MKKQQKGFSLIELLIVVAIIFAYDKHVLSRLFDDLRSISRHSWKFGSNDGHQSYLCDSGPD